MRAFDFCYIGQSPKRDARAVRMLSAEAFALGHLVVIAGGLIALVIMDRRSRHSHSRWHRQVRYRQLTTHEVLRRLRKAGR